MKKKTSILRFLATIVISGAAGAAFSILAITLAGDITGFLNSASDFLKGNILVINIIVCGLLTLTSLLLFLKARSIVAKAPLDEASFEKVGCILGRSLLFCTPSTICLFFFFAVASLSLEAGISNFWWSLVVLGFFLAANVTLEVIIVNMEKKLNPKMSADPLAFSFSSQWEKDSDEAEKFMMYKASYKVFMLLKYTFLIFWVVLFVLNAFMPIGILPFFMIALFWGIHSIGYCLFTFKTGVK